VEGLYCQENEYKTLPLVDCWDQDGSQNCSAFIAWQAQLAKTVTEISRACHKLPPKVDSRHANLDNSSTLKVEPLL